MKTEGYTVTHPEINHVKLKNKCRNSIQNGVDYIKNDSKYQLGSKYRPHHQVMSVHSRTQDSTTHMYKSWRHYTKPQNRWYIFNRRCRIKCYNTNSNQAKRQHLTSKGIVRDQSACLIKLESIRKEESGAKLQSVEGESMSSGEIETMTYNA